ncbi:MAG: hypothetical protein TR69_WS6001000587 [candidate division WS6 bacterium OLB20]|uniref:Uncharacterized protein n=1 Tax=candidate division WS6 bacterium OLB20 TaxID=1617426 RepID=A0A136LY57_9BACT|nr:MAG: hypothetical protein TR69_WS6001000587 [candidate division WS6 bacterium OLB20]
MINKRYPGQILVIVLLVLSILGIFVVSIATSTQRDVEERVRNEKYEQYYSLTERRLLQLIQETNLDSTLTGLENDLTNCTRVGNTGRYNCTYTDVSETDSLDQVSIDVTLEDTNEVRQLQLQKDQTFMMNLQNGGSGYRGVIQMQWTGPQVAWVVSMDYRDLNDGRYKVIKGVYDGNPTGSRVYEQAIPNNNTFTFEPLVLSGVTQPAANAMQFNISSVDLTGSNWRPLYLRVKPIIASGELLTELTVTGGTGFPNQVRTYLGEGISAEESNTGDDSPTAILEVQLPLHPAPAEFFDYVLRSENDVVKPR